MKCYEIILVITACETVGKWNENVLAVTQYNTQYAVYCHNDQTLKQVLQGWDGVTMHLQALCRSCRTEVIRGRGVIWLISIPVLMRG